MNSDLEQYLDKEFGRGSSTKQYAIKLLSKGLEVDIVHSDDNESGVYEYAVVSNYDDTFWWNAFPTEQEAKTWIKKVGLELVKWQ